MRRRDILAGAGSLATGVTLSFPAPAIAQGIRQLKMVTDWPEGTPGLHANAVRLAETIGIATGGRLKVAGFSAGAPARPFGNLHAGRGRGAHMRYKFQGFFLKKTRAVPFFPVMHLFVSPR